MLERSRTVAVLRALAALALFGCVGISICRPAPTPPPSDVCSTPSMGSVDTVEFASPRIAPDLPGTQAAIADAGPRMLAEGSALWLISGGQGAEMTPVMLVLRGSDVPSCIAQDTQITVRGQLAARNRDNLSTYPFGTGARITKAIWLPGAFEIDATLSSTVVGKSPSVNVRTGRTYDCPSLTACPCSTALETQDTGTLSPDGVSVWSTLQACLSCDGGDGCDGGYCEEERRACQTQPY